MNSKESSVFLYPSMMVFPVDTICQQIVLTLRDRNFEVPGLSVFLENESHGSCRYEKVVRVLGQDFYMWFTRRQGFLAGSDRFYDTAAIHEIGIPKTCLRMSSHDSAEGHNVMYMEYLGSNWRMDRDVFLGQGKSWMYPMKIGSTGLPMYLVYGGRIDDELLNLKSMPEKYQEAYGEPVPRAQVFNEVIDWLQKHVLDLILSQPTTE